MKIPHFAAAFAARHLPSYLAPRSYASSPSRLRLKSMRSSSLRHLLVRSRPSSLTLSSLRRLLRSHPGKLAAGPAARWSDAKLHTARHTRDTSTSPHRACTLTSYLSPHTFMDRCTGGLETCGRARGNPPDPCEHQTPAAVLPPAGDISPPALPTQALIGFRFARVVRFVFVATAGWGSWASVVGLCRGGVPRAFLRQQQQYRHRHRHTPTPTETPTIVPTMTPVRSLLVSLHTRQLGLVTMLSEARGLRWSEDHWIVPGPKMKL